MSKVLTISHDGNLVISGYGTLRLGDTNLSSIIAHAFSLNELDHKEIPAKVYISIHLKDADPKVEWMELGVETC